MLVHLHIHRMMLKVAAKDNSCDGSNSDRGVGYCAAHEFARAFWLMTALL